MNLPATIRTGVEAALARHDAGRIVHHVAVSGGCISPAARIETDRGQRWFVKWDASPSSPADFFRSQAVALETLAAVGVIRVPHAVAAGDHWLLLEWLDPGTPDSSTWPALGEQLARLHQERGPAFGWDAANYIGSLPQSNERCESWPDFWAGQRIGPQWEHAWRAQFFDAADAAAFDGLLAALPDVLAPGDDDGPSLVHGDLWGGNVHVMADARAALIDPASYHGHREVDLAMAELFGGFDRSFYQAYRDAWPLHPGYDTERRDVYQLYYLLVHVNLFGQGYVGGVRRMLRRYARKGSPL